MGVFACQVCGDPFARNSHTLAGMLHNCPGPQGLRWDTDRELLEAAAKAGGIHPRDVECTWNPLTDDGDALRLAVKLHIDVQLRGPSLAQAIGNPAKTVYAEEPRGDDPTAAARRAIVRAAAALADNK